jgi:hypothetical protein
MLPTALAVGEDKGAGSAGGGRAGGGRARPAATAAPSATGGRVGVRTSSGGSGDESSDMFVDQKQSPKVKFYNVNKGFRLRDLFIST